MMQCCTMLDGNFVARALALHRSLVRQGVPFHLWMLCTDEAAHATLTSVAPRDVTLLRIRDLEERLPAVAALRGTRTGYEYVLTLKPVLLRHLLETRDDMNVLSYLDADLAFYGDPRAILEELGNASILLTPHRLPDSLKKREVHGLYNAGFVAMRRNADGLAAAAWWSERTIEWCHDRVEGDKFIDQKYLERFPALFGGVAIAAHPGLNAAPWNAARHRYSLSGSQVLIDGRPLVFYHFHALRRLGPHLLDTGLALYRATGDSVLIRRVYRPYLRDLRATGAELKQHGVVGGLSTVRVERRAGVGGVGLLLSRLRKRQWLLG